MKTKTPPLLASLLLALVAGACAAGPAPTPGGLPVDGVTWQAVTVAGGPAVAGQEPTLFLKDGRVEGTTGCNSYGGGARLVDGRLTMDDVAMTAAACVDPAPGAVEAAFTAILFGQPELTVRGGQLIARGAAGEIVFEARAASEPAG